ncbi:hypothetical protein [Streptomyces hokutonensis]|uniref:hypothetical protein n=1 Tax=Streptomyces hokutonensis TaxID=1306990 RepID=UPI000368FB44|nr:hypothetical protein [Streptomyces hokutonensis]
MAAIVFVLVVTGGVLNGHRIAAGLPVLLAAVVVSAANAASSSGSSGSGGGSW